MAPTAAVPRRHRSPRATPGDRAARFRRPPHPARSTHVRPGSATRSAPAMKAGAKRWSVQSHPIMARFLRGRPMSGSVQPPGKCGARFSSKVSAYFTVGGNASNRCKPSAISCGIGAMPEQKSLDRQVFLSSRPDRPACVLFPPGVCPAGRAGANRRKLFQSPGEGSAKWLLILRFNFGSILACLCNGMRLASAIGR